MFGNHLGELWNRFNAAGGTPVLTAFGGVIVTGVTGYLLQERKSEIEDRRLQRDAKRSRGEELYHLFDNWLVGIRDAATNLKWRIQTGGLTENDIESAYGDQQAYRRLIMLTNIDFPSMKLYLENLGKEYAAYTNVLATIGAEPDKEVVVPPIEKFIEVVTPTGDRFQTALIRRMKELY